MRVTSISPLCQLRQEDIRIQAALWCKYTRLLIILETAVERYGIHQVFDLNTKNCCV